RLVPKPCPTKTLPIHGYHGDTQPDRFVEYGSDATALEQLVATVPGGDGRLAARLPYVAGQAIFAARHEMARTVEDVLARRLRALFLDAEAALVAAPRVAELLAHELGRDAQWQSDQLQQFRIVAEAYRPPFYS
ncbi:MAG: glycerol-3-phosphate dehydrogenase C-terminal domain-containing protein, partial [Pirellulales bacterium]